MSQSETTENNGTIPVVSYSDEARRFADIVNAYTVYIPWDQLIRSWVAIRLSDGGSDGVLYESKRDAVRHQTNEFTCAYFSYRNCPQGISYKEAEAFLLYTRGAYDAGFRLPDPDDLSGGPEAFMPVSQYDGLREIVNGHLYQTARIQD